jgi:hypothetical protein
MKWARSPVQKGVNPQLLHFLPTRKLWDCIIGRSFVLCGTYVPSLKHVPLPSVSTFLLCLINTPTTSVTASCDIGYSGLTNNPSTQEPEAVGSWIWGPPGCIARPCLKTNKASSSLTPHDLAKGVPTISYIPSLASQTAPHCVFNPFGLLGLWNYVK